MIVAYWASGDRDVCLRRASLRVVSPGRSDGGGFGSGDSLREVDRELVDHGLIVLVADLSLLGVKSIASLSITA